jgi:hypothetical protein
MPRQFERVSVSFEITLESSSGKRSARISDLSMAGCFIDTILDAAEGEQMNFDVKLPTGEPVQLSGKVTYAMPRIGFGIHFDELSEEKKQLLKQIILAYGGNPNTKPN